MILYHIASRDSVPMILTKGMKRTSRGEKGDDSGIMRTDKFLDSLRPSELLDVGVSRDDNLYAYLSDGDKVVSIDSGESIKATDFIEQADGVVLEVTVDATRCYVSDLNLYDYVKELVVSGQPAKAAAKRYWGGLVRLDKYSSGGISRPEVMVPYDIPPGCIEVVG